MSLMFVSDKEHTPRKYKEHHESIRCRQPNLKESKNMHINDTEIILIDTQNKMCTFTKKICLRMIGTINQVSIKRINSHTYYDGIQHSNKNKSLHVHIVWTSVANIKWCLRSLTQKVHSIRSHVYHAQRELTYSVRSQYCGQRYDD